MNDSTPNKRAIFDEYARKGKAELLTIVVICLPLFLFVNALFLLFTPDPNVFWVLVYAIAVILPILPVPVLFLFLYDCKHFDPERLVIRAEHLRVMREVSRRRIGLFGKRDEVDLYFETFRISLPKDDPLTSTLAVGKKYDGVFLETSLTFLAPLLACAGNPIRILEK